MSSTMRRSRRISPYEDDADRTEVTQSAYGDRTKRGNNAPLPSSRVPNILANNATGIQTGVRNARTTTQDAQTDGLQDTPDNETAPREKNGSLDTDGAVVDQAPESREEESGGGSSGQTRFYFGPYLIVFAVFCLLIPAVAFAVLFVMRCVDDEPYALPSDALHNTSPSVRRASPDGGRDTSPMIPKDAFLHRGGSSSAALVREVTNKSARHGRRPIRPESVLEGQRT